jgi:hypothetical protein
MAEQERIQRRKQRQKSSQRTESMVSPATSDARYEDAEKKLSEVDAAFDDFLATNQPATGNVVVGQQQPHQVVKPLSNEAFVRGFHQTSGE